MVLGTHGRRGLSRVLTGSVAERCVRTAPCPVMVIRPFDYSRLPASPAIEPACRREEATCPSRRRRRRNQWGMSDTSPKRCRSRCRTFAVDQRRPRSGRCCQAGRRSRIEAVPQTRSPQRTRDFRQSSLESPPGLERHLCKSEARKR
jgi:hypothetical protein